MLGAVSRWDDEKGFGFLSPSDGTKDVFCHYSGIAGEGYKSLEVGQCVSFDVEQGRRGPAAVNVVVIENEEEAGAAA